MMTTPKRSVEMQVLCLGFSRTGTMCMLCIRNRNLNAYSLAAMYTALQKLGYKSYHFLECSLHNKTEKHLECWHEALTNKLNSTPLDPAQLDRLLGTYSVSDCFARIKPFHIPTADLQQATTDAPCVNFTNTLLELYPTAKVILTNRDSDSWVRSIENSFYRVLEWPAWRWISYTHPVWLPQFSGRTFGV